VSDDKWKICPKNFAKWVISRGTFTLASPNQNVGGRVPPVPPIIAAIARCNGNDVGKIYVEIQGVR